MRSTPRAQRLGKARFRACHQSITQAHEPVHRANACMASRASQQRIPYLRVFETGHCANCIIWNAWLSSMRPLRLVNPAQRAICSMVTRNDSVVFLDWMNSLSFGSNRIPASFRLISNVALLIIRNPLTLVSHVPFGRECWRGQDPKILGRDAQREISAENPQVGLAFGRSAVDCKSRRSPAGNGPQIQPHTQSRGSAARFRLYQRLDRVGGNLLVSQVPQLQCGRLPATTAGIGRARRSHTRHHSHSILSDPIASGTHTHA
uniref:Uncharacterized protein n=1 Tax=Siphoviridae sp. ctsi73 TaxID=2825698 RepID=A0A8S5QHF9_9CAUD|nr:MAG TPA: hypothetical protein [Siphoviridae sp. ctsi73]